jgi:hypothetical protein
VSKITLHNYEAFLLDYMEGNLSAEDTAALKTFALLHPELDVQLDDEPVFLEKESSSYEAKSNVKALHTDEMAIAYVENTLTGAELQKAESLLKNNLPFQHDVALYKKTIAQPDTAIVFEHKQTLKREPKVIVLTQAFWMRSAAAFTLLAGLWILISNIKENPELNKSLKSVADISLKKEIESSVISSNENNTAEIQNENSSVKSEFAAVKSVTKIKANSLTSPEHENKTPNTEIEKESIDTEKELLADVNITSPEKETAPVFIKSTYIIEEGSDDELVAANTKPVKQNKLMAFASKAFKKLHQKGIEKVNGSDNNNSLVFGAFSVSKND